MDRRGFLKTLIGGVAATAAVRTFPFRVFSFPSEIASPLLFPPLAWGLDEFIAEYIRPVKLISGWARQSAIQLGGDVDEIVAQGNRLFEATPLELSSYQTGELGMQLRTDWALRPVDIP